MASAGNPQLLHPLNRGYRNGVVAEILTRERQQLCWDLFNKIENGCQCQSRSDVYSQMIVCLCTGE
jgi:hypothetical protein